MGPCAAQSANKKGGWKAALEFTLISPRPIEESPQSAAAAWVPQLSKRFRFDLTNAFARHREVMSDLFEGLFGAVFQAESHLDNTLFARGQCIDNLFAHFFEVDVNDRVCRRNNATVLNEVAKM